MNEAILNPHASQRRRSHAEVWLTESVPPESRITQAKTQANKGGASI
jgi:hypothetical protein